LAKKSKTSTYFILFIVLLSLLSIALIYRTNPTVIDYIPIGTGRQSEPTATVASTSSEPTATTTPEQTTTPQIPSSAFDNDTIKVGAFNLQIFGTSKSSKSEVMEVLSKIIRNYDVIAVQEIRDSSQAALPLLRDAVNSMGSSKYEYIVSARLGRTTSKEQYAYLFNTQTIQVIGSPYVYLDSNDIFQREPYVSEFKAKNGNFDFVLITIHTDPDMATQEINDLPKVVEDAKSRYQGEGDFIVMGDLNADCDYFKESSQSPLRSSDYLWIINNSVDTTTKSTACTYDRIIITTPVIADYTGKSGVFRFDAEYKLNYNSTIAISDHYPIYAEFWNNRDTD
jgi:deoxyribonuclease-1-like protein